MTDDGSLPQYDTLCCDYFPAIFLSEHPTLRPLDDPSDSEERTMGGVVE